MKRSIIDKLLFSFNSTNKTGWIDELSTPPSKWISSKSSILAFLSTLNLTIEGVHDKEALAEGWFFKLLFLIFDRKVKLSDSFNSIKDTPFGKFEFFDFMKEYRHRRFEKYVNDIYAVGDNQIMFPTHNSIAQARESAFLWEMYKDGIDISKIEWAAH